ncbi:hypothetical protein JL720_1650 [Aureococcus anophagefferens]|nr:hypothetical protein JL720_1650 [Aureococcus anophagefferens]
MESKGFAQTDEYFKSRRTSATSSSSRARRPTSTGSTATAASTTAASRRSARAMVSAHAGHNFEVQDGFGDPIIMYTVSEKARQRVSIPAETPEL